MDKQLLFDYAKNRNLTNRQLRLDLLISATYFSFLLQGKRPISRPLLKRIKKIYPDLNQKSN